MAIAPYEMSDLPPAAAADGPEEDFQVAAPAPNLGLAVLKRWPWLVVGVAAGLALGLLYHTQRPPVFQSGRQLLVNKNRTDVVASPGGGPDQRMAYVEDYVTTQVVLMRSQRILSLAGRRLQDDQFQIKPPAAEKDRIDFLMRNFGVVREREAGSSTPTNVLALSFRAGNAADSGQYLRAVIDAYTDELGTLYTQVSDKVAKNLRDEIERYTNTNSVKSNEVLRLTQEVDAVTQEEPSSIKSRISEAVRDIGTIRKLLAELDSQIALIQAAGPNRETRIEVLLRLGQQPRSGRSASCGPTARRTSASATSCSGRS